MISWTTSACQEGTFSVEFYVMMTFCKVLITAICMSIQLSHDERGILMMRKTWKISLLDDRGVPQMIMNAE
jgi:hypothetical protein